MGGDVVREWLLARSGEKARPSAPRGPMESRVSAVWVVAGLPMAHVLCDRFYIGVGGRRNGTGGGEQLRCSVPAESSELGGGA